MSRVKASRFPPLGTVAILIEWLAARVDAIAWDQIERTVPAADRQTARAELAE